MEAIFNEEQRNFKQMAIEFARRELNQGAKERERKGEFSQRGWEKCAEFGIPGITMPEKYGGLGLDTMTSIATMEGLGYACLDSGLLFSLNSHVWTCESPINRFGSEEQKKRYLPGLIAGSLRGGHAMTEPDAGSDAFSMRCRAEKRGDRYILNGSKTFITNAPIADLLLVFAVTCKEKGFAGVSAFIVERGFPGFSTGQPLETMGLRTCPLGEVFLEECEVPEENRLGQEGSGAAIFNSEMEWERSCLFAAHLGAMDKILEDCVAYAKERQQFGKAIGKCQSISHKISDMKVRIELSRLMLHQVATLKGQGKRAPLESAMAKLFISESYVQNCTDALQIHGAYGYSAEYDFERNLRDAIAGKIYSGTSEIQRNIIATFLGL
ncbi:short-chain acyl-CoA dehydrogenase [Citrifermentans bemidjiense Bem]|uniref:Short-chain acyl-CoA dehydrogenase n=1 Tax=Citrifermentans bemidjiense (strain ATCC BAA-1014 / DSM 16622 / JCM 12645 / Bem) TaxID=404380 RepID=B5ECE4_CITBB|nr:acyl-CoA dehydrogenase family protein [Citrifermentans bemidjiense]ACH37572.1 short-chain acyl-CoA dehydrogenase [Citrifermentans bemidjiense Bem]